MSTDNAIRASDADRERTVAILREGYASGRLTLAEFDERTTAAFSGRTWGELRALTEDLPAGPGPVPGHRGFRPPPARPADDDGERQQASALAGEGARLVPTVLIALIWLALTLSVHAAGALIPVVFLLLMAVRSAGRVRCGLGGRRQRPDWCGPSQRPGGRA